MNIAYRSAQVEGRNASYLEANSELQGSPAVLLPGWPMGPEMWRRVIPYLKYRIVAPSYPGWGESESSSENLSYATLAKFTGDLLSALRIEKANFIGISFGAAVALTLAHLHPEKVNAVVANAPPVQYEPYVSSQQKKLIRATQHVPLAKEFVYSQMVKGNRLIWNALIQAEPDNTDPFKRRVFEQIKTAKLDALWKTLQQILSTDLKTMLPQISVPTLILISKGDYMYNDSIYAVNAIPNSKLIEVQEGAHSLPSTHPAEFSKTAADFFAST